MAKKRSAREVARKVLDRCRRGSFATLALSGELESAGLDARDRGLATELTYGVLRQQTRLDWTLDHYAKNGLKKLDVSAHDILRVGAYELLVLKTPAHAVVDEAVEAMKSAGRPGLAGLANAILRRVAKEGEAALPSKKKPIARWGVEHSAPAWLIEYARAALDETEVEPFLASLNAAPPVWIRAHTPRILADALCARLAEESPGVEIARSDWIDEAIKLRTAGDVFRARAFAEGLFTAQDLAAQIAARLVAPKPGESILDACAGVGGKSTHLATLADDRARIVAADSSDRKLALCRDHAHRLGLKSIHTLRADLCAKDAPLDSAYDAILLDAPCSGLGVLRRHPEAKWRDAAAQASQIAELSQMQSTLLDALAARLRPGGRLVYSVCSFTVEEGPAQLARFLAAHSEFTVDRPTEPWAQALLDEDGALRTWPHRHDADAFYLVRLRRG